MVDSELIKALEECNERKVETASYFLFFHNIVQCFNAIYECSDGCGKPNAVTVIKQRFDNVRAESEKELQETLLYLSNRSKGEEK